MRLAEATEVGREITARARARTARSLHGPVKNEGAGLKVRRVLCTRQLRWLPPAHEVCHRLWDFSTAVITHRGFAWWSSKNNSRARSVSHRLIHAPVGRALLMPVSLLRSVRMTGMVYLGHYSTLNDTFSPAGVWDCSSGRVVRTRTMCSIVLTQSGKPWLRTLFCTQSDRTTMALRSKLASHNHLQEAPVRIELTNRRFAVSRLTTWPRCRLLPTVSLQT